MNQVFTGNSVMKKGVKAEAWVKVVYVYTKNAETKRETSTPAAVLAVATA
jgi:hypothetical protein